MSDRIARRLVWKIILGVCLAVFAAALVLLLIHILPTPQPVVSDAPVSSAPVSEPVVLPDNPIDFAAQKAKNPHVVGWIQIPGTVIDYPIMQSGNDVPENFYLNHAPDRSSRYAGSIYIQQMNRADFSHPNTLIYGHNMRNGSMFAALDKFRKKAFFDEHEYIYIYTPGHILTYRIFTAFVYDDRHILNSFNFEDPEEYASFLQQSLNPTSMAKQVRKGVSVTTEDRIITLSTCTTRDYERYLVEGVLIHDQPTN